MIVLTNKCCEILPIDDLSKIKIKGKINTLTYIVDDGKQKYRKNNFNHPRNADKEYPLMIIVDSKFKRLFCCGDDKKAINLRNELVSDTIVLQEDDSYHFVYDVIKKAKRALWIQNMKNSIKLFFIGLWYAGIKGEKIIVNKAKLTMENRMPQVANECKIFVGINEAIKKVNEIGSKIEAKTLKEQDRLFILECAKI